MHILITGGAGFIGFHMAMHALKAGHSITLIDNFNDYYDPALKKARTEVLCALSLQPHQSLDILNFDLADQQVFAQHQSTLYEKNFACIIHLAAQAGVRYSLKNPQAYVKDNIMAQVNMLEFVRHAPVTPFFIYASSSSVYGERYVKPADFKHATTNPHQNNKDNTDKQSAYTYKGFSETESITNPASFYAASKISGEILAQSYANLYGLHMAGLRFFSVYGPWGRPDMAYWLFAENLRTNEPLNVFAQNADDAEKRGRDFTYIDDIVDGVFALIAARARITSHEIYNLGNDYPVSLAHLITTLSAIMMQKQACITPPSLIYRNSQKGDVSISWANISKAREHFNYHPQTNLHQGLSAFIDWHSQFYT